MKLVVINEELQHYLIESEEGYQVDVEPNDAIQCFNAENDDCIIPDSIKDKYKSSLNIQETEETYHDIIAEIELLKHKLNIAQNNATLLYGKLIAW